MNNLHFKVGLIAFLFPVLLLAQTPNRAEEDRILDFVGQNLPTEQTTETAPSPALLEFQNKINNIEDISDEDKEFLKFRQGETAAQYIQRITIENQQRELNGITKLPDPTISTTQIPQEPDRTNVTPLDWQPADFLKDTNNNAVENDFLTNNPFSRLFPPGMFKDQTTPLGLLLNQLFYAGLAVAVILAVVMIIVGGVQYMTIDAAAQKDTGKKRVQAALGGLVLAFSAILILNTINPNLTKLSLIFEEIKAPSSTTTDGLPVTSGSRSGTIPQGNSGSWSETGSDQWVQVLPNGSRSTDGRLVVSVYSATGDAVTDTNTAAKRGNMNNLLREGSVALSPDLIEKHSPAHGSEIFINGISIGFYEDTTARVYNGVQFKNTVDIYDENNSLGTKDILKNIPAGEWNITFGTPRAQISNP